MKQAGTWPQAGLGSLGRARRAEWQETSHHHCKPGVECTPLPVRVGLILQWLSSKLQAGFTRMQSRQGNSQGQKCRFAPSQKCDCATNCKEKHTLWEIIIIHRFSSKRAQGIKHARGWNVKFKNQWSRKTIKSSSGWEEIKEGKNFLRQPWQGCKDAPGDSRGHSARGRKGSREAGPGPSPAVVPTSGAAGCWVRSRAPHLPAERHLHGVWAVVGAAWFLVPPASLPRFPLVLQGWKWRARHSLAKRWTYFRRREKQPLGLKICTSISLKILKCRWGEQKGGGERDENCRALCTQMALLNTSFLFWTFSQWL